MECISTTSLSILVIGILGDNFGPERGIRQSDPIFPYICIICAKYLGRHINFISNTLKTEVGIEVAKMVRYSCI